MKSVYFACISVLLACALGWAQSPIPLLIQPLVPASVAPGSGAFTLTVNGTGFTSNATVYWNGSLRSTTVVSSSTVQAKITAADVATAGIARVTVGNLGKKEVQSNVVYFPIRTSAKGLGFLPRSVQNILGTGPFVVGDFNNDGLLDIVAASGTTLQVFLGKGNGTFQPPVNIKTPTVSTLVAGDFNGDGNLDLALLVVGYGSRLQLRILLGDGKGGFPKFVKFQYLLDPASRILAAADFNHDGKLDIYMSRGFGHHRPELAVFLGDGKGGFSTEVDSGLMGRDNGSPAVADFNGDGNLDLAIPIAGPKGNAYLQVYLGIGDGTFNAPVNYPLRFGGHSMIAADVNGDGRVDLVSDGVSVLLGHGDGTFESVGGVASGVGGSVNVGDFNGDGKLDVASGASVLLGNGDGTFQKPLTFAGLASGFPFSVGGFNADGALDLLGTDALNGALTIAVQIPVYFTPTNLHFKAQQVGTTSPPQTAVVTNFGSKSLANVTVSLTGKNAADFSESNNCGTTLPPNGRCKIQTTFTPSLVGAEAATLDFTYQGSAALSMPLSGTGIKQTFRVTLTPSKFTFATQRVGTTSPPKVATLTNTGNQPITISSIAATAPFSQTNNCPSTLPVNSNCEIKVTFTPTDHGTVDGTLSVTDDATGSPQEVKLSGTGTAVVLSPTEINFGDQKVGTSSVPVPVTLRNLGGNSLSISGIVIKGADPNDFTQTNTCGDSVPPKSKCIITVTFTPTAKGNRSASVSISDDDPTSPQSVPLTGNGT